MRCGIAAAGCCGWRANARCRRRPTSPPRFATASSALERVPRALDSARQPGALGRAGGHRRQRRSRGRGEPASARRDRSAARCRNAHRSRRRLRRRAVRRAGRPRADARSARPLARRSGSARRLRALAHRRRCGGRRLGARARKRPAGTARRSAAARCVRTHDYAATTFRPSPENPRPPAVRVLDGVAWPSGERPVALAAHPQQGLALLSWMGAGQARLRRLDADTETLGAPISLPDARYAYALAWLDDERIRGALPGRHDAPAFALDDGEADDRPRAARRDLSARPTMRSRRRSCTASIGPPHYPTGDGSEPLHALSIANLARHGEAQRASADGDSAHLLDSGSQVTVWHRLYAEASIPPGAASSCWLAATAEPEPPTRRRGAWRAHRFGRDIARARGRLQEPARRAWEAWPSELPAHPGLGAVAAASADRAGLFSASDPNAAAARADASSAAICGCASNCSATAASVRKSPRLRCLGQPLLVSRPVPAATLSRDAVRRARASSRRTDRRARRVARAALDAGGAPSGARGRGCTHAGAAARPGRGDPRRAAWPSVAAATDAAQRPGAGR